MKNVIISEPRKCLKKNQWAVEVGDPNKKYPDGCYVLIDQAWFVRVPWNTSKNGSKNRGV